MLSQRERQTLAEIEEQLRASAPQLARSLERPHPWPPQHRGTGVRRATMLAGLVLGGILLAIALMLHSADCVVLAAAVLLTDGAWWSLLAAVALLRSRADRRGPRY